jgi:hypothetical protein
MSTAIEFVENRLDRRYEINFSLVYFPFTSKKAPSHKATAYNCSERGLCFHSPFALKPGQCICIRKGPAEGDRIADENAEALLKSFSLAEVRWCRKDESANITGYEIGVKYM